MPDTPLALDRSDGSLERIQATLNSTAERHDASARLLASCGRPIESKAMVVRAVTSRARAHGLAPALRAAARAVPIPTTVHARRVGRYPKAVESAVYFTCMEALQNTIKHAHGATEITVTLATRAGRLEFDVSDNALH